MPDMIKFAVCDDEPLMARELSASLEAYMEEHRDVPCSVRRFSSGRALLESGDSFDVVFLDVQMASPNGMDTARLLRRRGDRSLLVFVTVLKECVFDTFEVERPQPTVNTPHDLKPRPQNVPLSRPAEYRQW